MATNTVIIVICQVAIIICAIIQLVNNRNK